MVSGNRAAPTNVSGDLFETLLRQRADQFPITNTLVKQLSPLKLQLAKQTDDETSGGIKEWGYGGAEILWVRLVYEAQALPAPGVWGRGSIRPRLITLAAGRQPV